MKKIISYCLLFSVITCALPLYSYDISPPCYRQIQTNFFQDLIVAQALGFYGINQNLWIHIARDLRSASGRVPGIVRAQAATLVPNPLQRPFDPNKAVEILQSALYTVFFQVVNSYKYKLSSSNINNDTIAQAFQYMWLQQQAYILRCLGGTGVAY